MRISDWSSDVCSSDLHIRQIGKHELARLCVFHYMIHAAIALDAQKVSCRTVASCPALTCRRQRADNDRESPVPTYSSANIPGNEQIGRAHVCTPVTNAHLVCRLLLEKKKHPLTKAPN